MLFWKLLHLKLLYLIFLANLAFFLSSSFLLSGKFLIKTLTRILIETIAVDKEKLHLNHLETRQGRNLQGENKYRMKTSHKKYNNLFYIHVTCKVQMFAVYFKSLIFLSW